MKKSFCILITSALIFCALFAVVACDPESPDTRASRELDTSIVGVWQNAAGDVLVELENYEHESYQFVSDSGQSASSIDFSLDGGKTWLRRELNEDFLAETGRGIYLLMASTDGAFTFNATGSADDDQIPSPTYNAGDAISITVRVPESDTYKASAWSEATTYTLKAPSAQTDDLFADHYGSFLFDISDYGELSANNFESNGFVVYKEANSVKFGKISSSPSETESGMYDYVFTPFEELGESDKAEIAKLEYKFVSKQEYSQSENSSDLLSSITPSITTFENECLILGRWTQMPEGGIPFSSSDPDLLWEYEIEIPNATTGEIDKSTQRSFILLLRLKATNDTTHSNVKALEYLYPNEPTP